MIAEAVVGVVVATVALAVLLILGRFSRSLDEHQERDQ